MKKPHAATLFGAAVLFFAAVGILQEPAHEMAGGPRSESLHNIGTFSIVALDPDNGDLGVAVTSKFFAAGSIVPSAEPGVGAVATQAFANASYGPRGLELLRQGLSAEAVVKRLIAEDPEGGDTRQLAVVDAQGRVANHTGSRCIVWAGGLKSEQRPNIYSVQGNILAGEDVVRAMAKAFESTPGELADRMMAALDAGQAAGGDHRGRQSAGMLVVRKGAGFNGYSDHYVDIRVDDNPEPLKELRRLLHRAHTITRFFRAIELDKRGDLPGAIEELKLAIKNEPDYPDTHYSLATYYARSGKSQLAVRALKRALELNPMLKRLAQLDTNLQSLKNNAEYKQLIAVSRRKKE